MTRVLGLALLAATALSTAALAAPERIRGTVGSIGPDAITVHTAAGTDQTVALTGDSKYLTVKPSSLSAIDKDTYIGTATKEVGGKLIALEVVVFPNAMKGSGEGHYAWDRLPDTTTKANSSTSSMMTNGTVATASTTASTANTTMTNGSVAASDAKGGAKQLTVTYKGGEQSILVPPTAPIVLIGPGAMSDVAKGKQVVVIANDAGGKLTAGAVVVGTDGANPPM